MTSIIYLLKTRSTIFVFSKIYLLYLLFKLELLTFFGGSSFKFASYKMVFDDANIFKELFIDIFIKNQYHFESLVENPVVIDMGSHIGMSVLYFKILYPKAHVVAYEANPFTYKLLRKNINYNSLEDVVIRNKAVSDTPGRVYVKSSLENSMGWDSNVNREKKTSIQVDAVVVSEIISSLNNIDLVKIDIEGEEVNVIKEMFDSQIIKKVGNYIIEFHLKDNADEFSQVLDILVKNNFYFYTDYFFKFKIGLPSPFISGKRFGREANILIYAGANL